MAWDSRRGDELGVAGTGLAPDKFIVSRSNVLMAMPSAAASLLLATEPAPTEVTATVASTGNVNITVAPISLDGLTGVPGTHKWLLWQQTAPAENGLYLFNGGGAALTRHSEMNDWDSEVVGAMIVVELGATYANTLFISTADEGGTVGTTPIVFDLYSPGARRQFAVSAVHTLATGNLRKIINATGAAGAYNITLPVAREGEWTLIRKTDSSVNRITVKNPSAVTLVVLPAQNDCALLTYWAGVWSVEGYQIAPLIERFTASGPYNKLPFLKEVFARAIGAGGSGGGGGKSNTGTACSGGGGGGGGGCDERWIDAADIGATETVTIAAASVGGAGATVAGAGTIGAIGGTSTFGAHAKGHGGGRPSAGNSAIGSGGGSGGSKRSDGGSASGATGGAGAASGVGGNGGGAAAGILSVGGGGGGGGGGGTAAGAASGSGPGLGGGGSGGASGGGVTSANAFQIGGTAAYTDDIVAFQQLGGATDGAAGTAAATLTKRAADGGSGGAGSVAVDGGAGGAGGAPGGGGGGGGGSQGGNGGVGGNGGRGEVLTISFF